MQYVVNRERGDGSLKAGGWSQRVLFSKSRQQLFAFGSVGGRGRPRRLRNDIIGSESNSSLHIILAIYRYPPPFFRNLHRVRNTQKNLTSTIASGRGEVFAGVVSCCLIHDMVGAKIYAFNTALLR